MVLPFLCLDLDMAAVAACTESIAVQHPLQLGEIVGYPRVTIQLQEPDAFLWRVDVSLNVIPKIRVAERRSIEAERKHLIVGSPSPSGDELGEGERVRFQRRRNFETES